MANWTHSCICAERAALKVLVLALWAIIALGSASGENIEIFAGGTPLTHAVGCNAGLCYLAIAGRARTPVVAHGAALVILVLIIGAIFARGLILFVLELASTTFVAQNILLVGGRSRLPVAHWAFACIETQRTALCILELAFRARSARVHVGGVGERTHGTLGAGTVGVHGMRVRDVVASGTRCDGATLTVRVRRWLQIGVLVCTAC
jgi:hypothetical protein